MNKKTSKKSTEVAIPEVWRKNPIFAATRQTEPREIAVGDDTVWSIGIVPPVGQVTPYYLRAFDVRHAEVIFALFGYFRDNGLAFNAKVNLSYTKLLKIVGWQDGSPQRALIKDILGDLTNIWTKIVSPNYFHEFKVISSFSRCGNPHEPNSEKIARAEFDPKFVEFLEGVERNLSIRLDVFNSISSGIAKSIYLYIPSRALKSTKEKPFRITLTNLFEQINIPVEKYKSKRLQKLTQHRSAVIEQLDNLPINFNKKLRVRIEETRDGKDYNLCAWAEEMSEAEIKQPQKESLLNWFINGNRGSVEDFNELIKCNRELNDYEVCALEIAGVDLKESERFLKLAKSLLGETVFSEVCGNAKQAANDGSVKNPTAYLIALVRAELLNELPLWGE
jgi:hypothetical protein